MRETTWKGITVYQCEGCGTNFTTMKAADFCHCGLHHAVNTKATHEAPEPEILTDEVEDDDPVEWQDEEEPTFEE